MDNRGKRTFLEWVSDILSSTGKRFLFGMAIGAIGVLLAFVPILFISGIGVTLALFGIYTAISILESQKTYYVNSLSLSLNNGEKVTCAIFKQKCHAYVPIVFFFSPFFYFPYKVQYIIVKNMTMPNTPCNTKVSPQFLANGLLDIEVISTREYKEIQANPLVVAEKISSYFGEKRAAFVRETKPFFDTSLMEEIYYDNKISICKILKDTYIIFHYQSYSGKQCGMLFNKDFVDKIIQDTSFLLESYLSLQNPSIILLTDEVLERLLRDNKNDVEPNEQVQQYVEHYVEKNESKKQLLTRQLIEQRIYASSCRGNMVGGILLLIPALGGIELGIASVVLGMFWGLIFLAGGIACLYYGIRNIRRSKNNKKNALQGSYRIIRTKCIEHNEVQETDADGDPCGVSHTHKFANGDEIKLNFVFAVSGDIVYLVYLEGSKKINACFNAIEFKPAPDLQIIDMVGN